MKKLTPLLIFLIVLIFSASAQIVVDEGELISLDLQAVDEDGDPITYSFSSPLDENGEWQTSFEDAGIYEATISASDGQDTTTQTITITVNNVNQAPDISYIRDISVNEREIVNLNLRERDQDGDIVNYEISEPLGNQGIWETSFRDAGIYTINIIASDDELFSEKTITLTVGDIDRGPNLESSLFRISEGENFRYTLEPQDADGDPIRYTVKGLPEEAEVRGNEIILETNFNTLRSNTNWFEELLFRMGVSNPETNFEERYNIEITGESNGKSSTSTITLIIENENRAPTIDFADRVLFLEGEEINLEAGIADPDGDPIKTSYSGFMNSKSKKTDFGDEGIYEVTISASDGNLRTEKTVEIELINNNRLPFLNPNSSRVYENEESVIELNAEDLDGEEVRIDENSIPSGVVFDERDSTLRLSPSYEFVDHTKEHTRNVFVRMLNGVFGIKSHERDIVAKLELDDGLNTTVRDYKITVKDVNRAPIMNILEPITVREGERLYIPVNAIDPDGDTVYYRFVGLVRRNNRTISYNKWGEYTQTVIASDGSLETSVEIPVTVINVNRAPELSLPEINIEENETIKIELRGRDLDGDNFTYSLVNVPQGTALVNETVLEWTPSYEFVNHQRDGTNRSLIYEVQITDSLGDSFTANNTIRVDDVNRKPELVTFSPAQRFVTNQGRTVDFFVSAVDPDGDELRYYWGDEGIEGGNTHTRQLLALGERDFVVAISDGQDVLEHQWKHITRRVVRR